MTITDIYAKRARRERGEMPDVYQYYGLPEKLRIQIINIFRKYPIGLTYCEEIVSILCDEMGEFDLRKYSQLTPKNPIVENEYEKMIFQLYSLIYRESDIDVVLSCIELIFQELSKSDRGDNPVQELNTRFRENGVGYQFESGQIIRVDSQLIHAEVVQPVLALLRAPEFEGANAEFLKAHEHYRHSRYDSALVEASKAFESTMKTICDLQQWKYKPASDTAKNLITICLEHHLLPAWQENQLQNLQKVLEGTATPRNKPGAAHGGGSEVKPVPEHIVRYALNMTASAILLLIEAESVL